MTKSIALITGVLGQDGSYLAQYLLEHDYIVYGTVRTGSSFANHDYLGIAKSVRYLECDLANESQVIDVIKSLKPAELYHLGGLTAPGKSWENPITYTHVNSLGMLYLLEALNKHSRRTKLFNAATSEMFGESHNDGLQTELTPCQPTNPYAVTKLYAYSMGNIYRNSYHLFIANGILFSHESPLRGVEFVTRRISQGVARIFLGLADKIILGNITSYRDWGYAGDYVKAMWLMLQQAGPDDYVISTGKVHSIRDFLATAFGVVGIKAWEQYIQNDPSLFRPIDLNNLHGSSDKARKVLDWQPKVTFGELVEMMVKADIKRLSKESR